MSTQLVLAQSDIEREIDGIEMGVLRDGTAYLTGRGVARLCGAAESTIRNQRDEWSAGRRNNKFAKLLQAQGYTEPELFIALDGRNAYPEQVCMTLLEYFAFETPTPSLIAQSNFRKLARAGLRLFVYTALGYDPQGLVPPQWRQFHDRLALHATPIGFFSVFKESADFVLAAIRGGLAVDQHTIPDISVGKAWSAFWVDQDFEKRFGLRFKHDHNYPDYFPQAASNPQPMWVYPIDALGEFRRWLQTVYVPERFPKYLTRKVKDGLLPASTAEILIDQTLAPELKELPAKPSG